MQIIINILALLITLLGVFLFAWVLNGIDDKYILWYIFLGMVWWLLVAILWLIIKLGKG